MERQCGALTLQGNPCRHKVTEGQEKCWLHNGPVCSVCLNAMSGLQPNRTLPCGHTFHQRCVDRWKRSAQGPDPTCPMCREPFDVATYRCRLIIEKADNNERTVRDFETQNIASIIEGFGLDFSSIAPGSAGRFYTDIRFDINVGEVLEDILRELGLPTS